LEVGYVNGGFDWGIQAVQFGVRYYAHDFHRRAPAGDALAERVFMREMPAHHGLVDHCHALGVQFVMLVKKPALPQGDSGGL
jgi:hypothetical protein